MLAVESVDRFEAVERLDVRRERAGLCCEDGFAGEEVKALVSKRITASTMLGVCMDCCRGVGGVGAWS